MIILTYTRKDGKMQNPDMERIQQIAEKCITRNRNEKQPDMLVKVEYARDCPFIKPATEYVEAQAGEYGYVCNILRLDKGGRARCNSSYPPRHCPLLKGRILVTVKRD